MWLVSIRHKIKYPIIFSFPKSKSLSRLKLRRLNEDEKPLVLAILWGKNKEETKKFVLQVFLTFKIF